MQPSRHLVGPDVANEQVRAMTFIRPKFKTFTHEHEDLINNEYWYNHGRPALGKSFSKQKTIQRHRQVIGILRRAEKRETKAGNDLFGSALQRLADKLAHCKPHFRCGSLACPQCARAFQRAKVAGQSDCIKKLAKSRAEKALVMANVIPLWMTYTDDQLGQLDINQANRWLQSELANHGFNRIMFGSADISLEDGYYQLHWHIAIWTSNPARLTKRLKQIFPSEEEYDRPVHLKRAYDFKFLPYKDKGIKLPDLLRRNKMHLANLMLALDRTEPLTLMLLTRLRLSAQNGRLVFGRSKSKRRTSNWAS
jgi:hypothetical protein